MLRGRVVGVSLVVLLTGCDLLGGLDPGQEGTAPCDQFGNGAAALQNKLQQCNLTGVYIPFFSYVGELCTQGKASNACLDSEQQKLVDFGNCVSALPSCSITNAPDWATKAGNCLQPLGDVVNHCK